MSPLAKYFNGAAMLALIIASFTTILPYLVSAKDTMLVVSAFVYVVVLVPIMYFWARKVFFSETEEIK